MQLQPCRGAVNGLSKKLGCIDHLWKKDPLLYARTIISSALANCKAGGSIKGVSGLPE